MKNLENVKLLMGIFRSRILPLIPGQPQFLLSVFPLLTSQLARLLPMCSDIWVWEELKLSRNHPMVLPDHYDNITRTFSIPLY